MLEADPLVGGGPGAPLVVRNRVGQAGRVPYEDDFAPDEQGLADALRRLVEFRGAPGSPHIDPDLVLDLPAVLPETGFGAGRRWAGWPARRWARSAGWTIRASSPTWTRPRHG